MKPTMSKTFFQLTSLTLFIFLIFTRVTWSQESNWTHFRGSDLRAIAHVDHIPVQWDTLSHTVWKTAIHGRGWSSPVIYGNQIWLTTATGNGKEIGRAHV